VHQVIDVVLHTCSWECLELDRSGAVAREEATTVLVRECYAHDNHVRTNPLQGRKVPQGGAKGASIVGAFEDKHFLVHKSFVER